MKNFVEKKGVDIFLEYFLFVVMNILFMLKTFYSFIPLTILENINEIDYAYYIIVLLNLIFVYMKYEFNFNKKKVFIVAVFLVVGSLCFGGKIFKNLIHIFFISYIYNRRIKEKIKMSMILTIILTATVFLGCYLKIFENVIHINHSGKIRNSLGFQTVNILAFIYFYIYQCNAYLEKRKNILKELFFLGLGFLIYQFTGNRTAIISIFLLSFLSFSYYYVVKLRLGRWLFKTSFLLLGCLTIILAIFSDKLSIINKILSLRPYYWNKFLITTNFNNLFISNDLHRFNPIDNSYLYAIYGSGVVVFLLLSYIYFKAMEMLIREGKKNEVLILVGYAIYAFMENIYFYSFYNISLIIIFFKIVCKGEKDYSGEE